MSDSYVMIDYVLTNNSQLVELSVPNLRVQSYWLSTQRGRLPHTRGRRGERPVEGPPDAVRTTRRRIDEEAGGVRLEGGVTLGDGAIVGDDDATTTIEV